MKDGLNLIHWRDEPRNEGLVERVDGTSVSLDDHTGFVWPDWTDHPIPQVGDRVAVIGGFGHPFYGVVVEGTLVGWLTPEERDQRHRDMVTAMNERREREFVENEAKLNADYAALPLAFQFRIDQLRAAGGRDWRVQTESYEMFVCTEAAKMAAHFTTVEALERWWRLPHGEQRAEWGGYADGHSGNTFGAACHLAREYLRSGDRSEALVAAPQAMAPIAGDPRYR